MGRRTTGNVSMVNPSLAKEGVVQTSSPPLEVRSKSIVENYTDETVSLTGSAQISAPQGKIVVSNDEWPLSDEGFQETPEDARRFALNLANSFAGARSGNFLVYSTQFGLTTGLAGTQLKNTLEAAGHHVDIINTTRSFTVDELLQAVCRCF